LVRHAFLFPRLVGGNVPIRQGWESACGRDATAGRVPLELLAPLPHRRRKPRQ
jgi:hypothetical protein